MEVQKGDRGNSCRYRNQLQTVTESENLWSKFGQMLQNTIKSRARISARADSAHLKPHDRDGSSFTMSQVQHIVMNTFLEGFLDAMFTYVCLTVTF